MTDLATDIAGRVLTVDAAPGKPIAAGDTVIVVEAMKMEIAILAEHAGMVAAVMVAVDQMIEEGQVIARIEPAA
jgi:biotin carboxyl carrier protein